MQLSTILSFALFTVTQADSSLSLLDALKTQANATLFAQFLEANPSILAIYNSSTVRTVFAPSDAHFVSPNTAIRRRQGSSQQQQLLYQYTDQLTDLENLTPPAAPGKVVHMGLTSPQVAGGSQAIVSHKVAQNSTTKRRRDTGTVPSSGVQILSGLGNKVNILGGDIPYSNGLIHSTDGFFTVPTPLSSTINSTGLSSLGSLLNQANLTGTLDASDSITIFTPNNAAFAATNITGNPSTLPAVLSNHVIPNFLGYLPSLTDGATYTTLAGDTLTVTIKNGVYYVNDAKIVSSNTILQNGVAHVIDKVLTPSLPAPVVVTGDSWSLSRSNSIVATVSVAIFALLVV